jgi:hypothetical protein
MLFGVFQPLKPEPGETRHGFSPGPRTRIGSILLYPAAASTFSAAIQARFTLASRAMKDVPVTIKCVAQTEILFSASWLKNSEKHQ